MVKIIRVIGKLPGHPPFEVFIPNDLRALQTFVRGYIETVTVGDAVVICNEEGFLLGLPYNCHVDGLKLVGPILLVGRDGDEFADAPEGARNLITEVQHDQP